MMRPRHSGLLLLFLLSGCSAWKGTIPTDSLVAQPGERRRFQVWHDGKADELHAVRIVRDTLQGVHWWKDPKCDSCLVSIPRTKVDSVRIRETDGTTTVLGLGIIGYFAYATGLWFIIYWALH